VDVDKPSRALHHFDVSRNIEIHMKPAAVVTALAALAHESRLAVYRMLVEAGPEGLAAGTVAERLKMPPSSLTFHLQNLQRAGLITRQRMSRQLIYAADFTAMNTLVGFLTENCCGQAGSCAPACAPTRAPAKTVRKGAKAA
jgi:ArsR family transcriptional regulator, arsenate/arsenite/antimonite-responsive transcriptional repressor